MNLLRRVVVFLFLPSGPSFGDLGIGKFDVVRVTCGFAAAEVVDNVEKVRVEGWVDADVGAVEAFVFERGHDAC
jgi:hypothetical protein